MTPPPAEQLASRVFLGPALRAQPDRRLVTLVRDGYEAAFEEIVRRYRRPLDRFAASIVGGRSEDITQDAFSKALGALRRSEAEIELRPWLYRIVRNTALNDLRDRPPATEQLGEAIPGGRSAAAEAERRAEMSDLVDRLQALPEPQRAAIVMRELEGLSHEKIAASLGLSGGAARQVIYRARQALRDGLGLLVPLPLVRALFDRGAEAAGAGGAIAAAGSAAGASGVGGATLGALGTGGALKLGMATVLVIGGVGAGVAAQQHGGGPKPAAASAATLAAPGEAARRSSGESGHSLGSGEGRGRDRGRPGSDGRGRHEGSSSHGDGSSNGSHSGEGSSPKGSSNHGGNGSDGGNTGSGDGGDHSDSGDGGSGHSGSGGSGGSGSGSGDSGSGDGVNGERSGASVDGSGGSDDFQPSGSGRGTSGSDSGGGGSGSSDDSTLAPTETSVDGSGSGSGSGSSAISGDGEPGL